MTKKEAIENLARIIVNRVKYHAPLTYDGEINFKLLEEFGIDLSLPVFKFENKLTKPLIKAFSLAKKVVDFNFVTTNKTNCPFALFLPREHVCLELLQNINKLNINYKSTSNFEPFFERDFLKINGKILDLKYNKYCLEKFENIDGVLVTQREFVCSGQTVFLELCNSNKIKTEIEISYNKNLQSGYYYFSKDNTGIKAVNLYNKNTTFLNANFEIKNSIFSCVSGVENSRYPCIKFLEKIVLKPFQRKVVFINYGEKRFSLKNEKEFENLFDFSFKKCCENFDLKIETMDKNLDEKINNLLPRDIWIAWANGKRDYEKEEEYLSFKNRLFLRKENKIIFSNNDFNGFKKIELFDGVKYRDIEIKHSCATNSLKIDRTSFMNLKTLSLDKISPHSQICLQFK